MTLIPRPEAKKLFSSHGKKMDDRTFEKVVKQYGLKRHPVGNRIKYNEDEIKRKIKLNAVTL